MGLIQNKIDAIKMAGENLEPEPELIEYNSGDLVEIHLFHADKKGKIVDMYEPSIDRKIPYLATVIHFDLLSWIDAENVINAQSYKDFTEGGSKVVKKLLMVIPFDSVFTQKKFGNKNLLLTTDQVSPCYFQRDLKVVPNVGFNLEYNISRIEPKFDDGTTRAFRRNEGGIWFHLKDTSLNNPTSGRKIEYLDLVKDYDIVWE